MADAHKVVHEWTQHRESCSYRIGGINASIFMVQVSELFGPFQPHDLKIEFVMVESPQGSPWVTKQPTGEFVFTMASPPWVMDDLRRELKSLMSRQYGLGEFQD